MILLNAPSPFFCYLKMKKSKKSKKVKIELTVSQFATLVIAVKVLIAKEENFYINAEFDEDKERLNELIEEARDVKKILDYTSEMMDMDYYCNVIELINYKTKRKELLIQ